jgi:cation transport ATPase
MSVEPPPNPLDSATSNIDAVLHRPPSERLREYKYRFAQSTVFGLPVLALHFAGPSLGGSEAARWIGLLQLLLTTWVMYVGVIAMGVEALLRRRFTADAAAAAMGAGFYLAALCNLALIAALRSTTEYGAFAATVAVAMLWNGGRWLTMTGQAHT